MYDSNAVADRIREIAKSKKLSMKQVLADAGLGYNTMTTYRTSMPKADNLAKIADCLDCSVDYLLGRTDDPLAHKRRPDETDSGHEGGMVIPPVKGE